MVQCQLWMGGLEPYMNEAFILASFKKKGENPITVKVMKNKQTGEPAGYCFIQFENDDEAVDAMHKLNGKIIPETDPPVRFKLNSAMNQDKVLLQDKDLSLWVGDLSSEIDDYILFKTFSNYYQSLKTAKVILDTSGVSKGFGFLRFGSEEEQKHCLENMNGFLGLGSKPIKISNAVPKYQKMTQSNINICGRLDGLQMQQEYCQLYNGGAGWWCWPGYSNAGWSGYYGGGGGGMTVGAAPNYASMYGCYVVPPSAPRHHSPPVDHFQPASAATPSFHLLPHYPHTNSPHPDHVDIIGRTLSLDYSIPWSLPH